MPVPSAFQFHPAGLEGAHAGCLSDGVLAHFARTDADRLLDLVDEDLAVADLAGVGGLANGLDGLLENVVGDDGLDLELGQEVHNVFGTAVELGVTLLAAKALHFRDGKAVHADVGECLTNFIELERLDDGNNQLHDTCTGTRAGNKKTDARKSIKCRPACERPNRFFEDKKAELPENSPAFFSG